MNNNNNNNNNKKAISVLVLGKTGVGKSTFCNFLSRDKKFVTSDLSHTCTQNTNSYTFSYKNQHSIKIIDSPGLGEVSNWLEYQHYNEIISEFQKGIDFVILCIEMGRIVDEASHKAIQFYCDLLPLYIQQGRFIVLYTKFGNEKYFTWKRKNLFATAKEKLISDLSHNYNLGDNSFVELICSEDPPDYYNNNNNNNNNSNNNNNNIASNDESSNKEVESEDDVYSYSRTVRASLLRLFTTKEKNQSQISRFPILPCYRHLKLVLLAEMKGNMQLILDSLSRSNSDVANLQKYNNQWRDHISSLANSKNKIENEIQILSTNSTFSAHFCPGNDSITFVGKRVLTVKQPLIVCSKFTDFYKNCSVQYRIKVPKSGLISNSYEKKFILREDIVKWASDMEKYPNSTLEIVMVPSMIIVGNPTPPVEKVPTDKYNKKDIRWYYYCEFVNNAIVMNAKKLSELNDSITQLDSDIARHTKLIDDNQASLLDSSKKSQEYSDQLLSLQNSIPLLSLDTFTHFEFQTVTKYLDHFITKNKLHENNLADGGYIECPSPST